jgi:cytochrome c biogenesis protein CcdA
VNELSLTIGLWVAISTAYVVTGAATFTIAKKLHPFGWPLYLLGGGYLITGLLGLATVAYAVYRISLGFNPTYGSIGYAGYTRMGVGFAFTAFKCVLFTFTAYRLRQSTPAELQTILDAVRVFARLKRTVEAVK